MAVFAGPEIVNDGLVCVFDPASRNSYYSKNWVYNTHTLGSGWGISSNVSVEITNETAPPPNIQSVSNVFKITGNDDTIAGARFIQQGYLRWQNILSWTSSVYIKMGTYKYARLSPSIAANADGVTINLETGEIIRVPYNQSYNTYSVKRLENNWFRLSRTKITDSYWLKCFALHMTNYTGNSDSGASLSDYYPKTGEYIYIAGPQFELGDKATKFEENTYNSWVLKDTKSEKYLNYYGISREDLNKLYGAVLPFDGTNDRMYMSGTDYLDISQDYSISLWFKLNEVPTLGSLFSLGNSYGEKCVIFGFGNVHLNEPSSSLFYREYGTDNASRRGALISPVFQADSWYNIVFTSMDSASKVYINSSLIHEDTALKPAGISSSSGIWLGSNPSVIRYFNGDISQVKLYQKVLTESEIQQNFEATRSRYGI